MSCAAAVSLDKAGRTWARGRGVGGNGALSVVGLSSSEPAYSSKEDDEEVWIVSSTPLS